MSSRTCIAPVPIVDGKETTNLTRNQFQQKPFPLFHVPSHLHLPLLSLIIKPKRYLNIQLRESGMILPALDEVVERICCVVVGEEFVSATVGDDRGEFCRKCNSSAMLEMRGGLGQDNASGHDGVRAGGGA